MIFEELVLHNFGVYLGRHAIALDVSPERPIVLVGALNGSGKTTFLDAMQLALYGKNARCTGRERVSYSDYLQSMINRSVAPDVAGASVEFAFRTRTNGQDNTIRVSRTWKLHGQSVREALEVSRDGVLDTVASERWQEYVEDFMPSQIADLFFFDGEKVEALADPMRSAALLRVAVHSLLGIDLVESLIKSLQLVERKRNTSRADVVEREELESLERELEALADQRRLLVEKAGASRTALDSANGALDAAGEEFKRVGGELFGRRSLLQAEESQLREHVSRIETELLSVAAGILPIVLADELVQRAIGQAKGTQLHGQIEFLRSEMTARDAELVKFLKSIKADKDVVVDLKKFLKEDLQRRYVSQNAGVPIPDGLLTQYRPDEIDRSKERARALISDLRDAKERLAAVIRHLNAVPDEAVIAEAQGRVDACRSTCAKVDAQISIFETEIGEIDGKIARLTQKRNAESERLGRALIEEEISQRTTKQAAQSRAVLGKFRDRLLQENLERLQGAISSCFQKLLRKQSLFRSVLIDPATFQMSVIHPSGSIVSAHRLSAGERQLLAVATLWALSRASGRHLPTVIDTPLSRLDSRHRGTIVKTYFPAASHQVILLSTDEEVVGKYYQALLPHVGREYIIQHDEERNTSEFRDGYFSESVELEARAA